MKYDVFISYRRTASETATLIAEKLRSFGYRVFLDVETLNSGKFNEQILNEIAQCKDVVVVLPENALDRCDDSEDWVRQEVCCAMQHDKNIIPVMLRNFSWPDPMPAGMEELKNYQAVTAGSPEYFDLAMQRLSDYLNSRPHTKYRIAAIRASIVVSVIIFCIMIAYAVFRVIAVPVCTEATDGLTTEMEVVNQLAGINCDLKKDWSDYFRLMLSAQTPQRLLNMQSDMLTTLDHWETQLRLLQNGLPYPDFTYSDYRTFLLSLYNIDVAELQASTTYTNLMFDTQYNNIDYIRNSIRNIGHESLLNNSIIEMNFDCYQCDVNVFYYGYMELMSHMPKKSLANYSKLSTNWTYINQTVSLSLSPEEYQDLQEKEIKKIEQKTRTMESSVDKLSDDMAVLAQKLDKMAAMLPFAAQSNESEELMQNEINTRIEKINADCEYIELRKRELAEIDRKYEETYNQLRAQCQLREDDQPSYMWGKIVHWGNFLGTLTVNRKNAERQGIYSTSSVTPARALAEMNSLLSCYQTYNPESAAYMPSVKVFFKDVAESKFPLKGVLIFGFKDDAEHPLYKAGDIIIERNGIPITNYSQLLDAAKLADGGTVAFLRLENGELRSYNEYVPKSDVLVGYMELTESE